jgi:hypothetical protein
MAFMSRYDALLRASEPRILSNAWEKSAGTVCFRQECVGAIGLFGQLSRTTKNNDRNMNR